MSVRIESAVGGLLTIKVSGQLSHPDWRALLQDSIRYIEEFGTVRILVIAEDFGGWERKGDWGDLTFQAKYDRAIERMAVVGEKRWEDLTLMFTAKGFRPFPIEYFQPSERARAEAWLKASAAHTPQTESSSQ